MTRLCVFGRPATAGRTKTRLASAIGEPQAAALYRAFVADVLANTASLEAEQQFWVAGDPHDPDLEGMLPPTVARVAQPQGDLGARMLAALRSTQDAALVVGTDAPTLPVAYLQQGLAALRTVDVVLGASADGGYYTIGARNTADTMFDGVRWSTRHALADTLGACERAHLSTEVLPPWYDVDTFSDLTLLRAELALAPHRAPHTVRALVAQRVP